MPGNTQLFAVIPAAGQSRRMGRPKLLLPVGDRSLISRVIETFRHPEIAATVVVTRQSDVDLQQELAQTFARVVTPDIDPPHMRDSIELALDEIERTFRPLATDGWILCPADHPLLDRDILAELLTAWQNSPTPIQVPVYGGKRGHPVFFRWETVADLRSLPGDVGVNALLKQRPELVTTVDVDDEGILIDLDTPADYDKLCRRWSS
ncbi:MAG: nucleotidyltransferase family protein [Planctomycetota bacterium]|nr:nucleotidyltransferase family protein [Planctomycetota bacterium]MDA1214593.1 nucleotidyltransferase family protein [Planctomycetota bacterium]